MVKNKKEIIKIITYAICLFFGFIYIRPIMSFGSKVLEVLMPFIIGVIIAFILNILMNAIENKWLKKPLKNCTKKEKRGISLTLAIIFVLSLLAIVFLLIVPEIKNNVELFIEHIPEYQANLNNIFHKNIFNEVGIYITEFINNNKDKLLNMTLGFASNVIKTITDLFIGMVFAVYLLSQKEKLISQFGKLFKAYFPKKKIKRISEIAELSNTTFANFITGQCMEATIFGLLCFIGMLFLGLPYALAISVLMGFTALIPIFGAFIGTVFGAFLIFMSSPFKALIFVVFVLILQQVEGNFIYPKVVGKKVNLPSIWVLFAVTIGASIGGVAGMLLSVPLCSVLYSILSHNVNERLEKEE